MPSDSSRTWIQWEGSDQALVEEGVPSALPTSQTATFNPGFHDPRPRSGAPSTEADVAPRWSVKRDDLQVATTGVAPARAEAVPDAPHPGYTLHHVIARGGFGEIWQATQESLGRVVAVKRIRQSLIDQYQDDGARLDDLEWAFRQEALVAACLEHPNILPVHDLGVGADGHLLLATKLVRGKPWDLYMEETASLVPADFLDLHLPILEAVAQAVAFAHARGIVHRDLKPSQVMVGEFGEVLLMDWGIAMFMSESPPIVAAKWPSLAPWAPTPQTASNPAGTAAYMAPEQTEGTVGNIGPWTDVYLLGGILYELLTGRYPHGARTHRQSFARAMRGIVPSPWEAAPDRDIPTGLAATAMACLQPDRRLRLRSADDFISLLRDYRAGASRRREAEELQRRAALQFDDARDYKALAQCQALVGRALLLWPGFAEAERLNEALALRHARLAIANHDLKLARLQAERLDESRDERRDLMAEIDRLEDEQARARERLDEAFRRTRAAHSRADRLVSFLLDDLHTSLQAVNRLDLLAKVGREALEYFEALSDDETTPDSMAKRAVACRNIGDVFKNQGNAREAEAAFRNFRDISVRLCAVAPGDWKGLFLLAESHERLSSVKYLKGDLDDCLRLLEEGLSLVTAFRGEQADDPETRWLDARLVHQKGVALWRRRELDDALACQSASLAAIERLVDEFPDRDEFRASLGWNLSTLGNVHRDLGSLQQALASTRRAVAVRQQLHDEDPENKARLDDVGWSLTNLALLQEYVGDFEGALAMYAQAEAMRRRLYNEDPTNAIHRNTLAFILSSRGRNLHGFDRSEEAGAVLAESSSISRALFEGDPTNVRELGGHALNLAYAGLAHFALGRHDEARALAAEARPLAARALHAVPANGVFQNARCQSWLLDGLLAARDGDVDGARALWHEAATLLEAQAWRTNTGQGAGLHLELCLLLGRDADALDDAQLLRGRKWMLPRWERLLAERGL